MSFARGDNAANRWKRLHRNRVRIRSKNTSELAGCDMPFYKIRLIVPGWREPPAWSYHILHTFAQQSVQSLGIIRPEPAEMEAGSLCIAFI